MLALVLTAALQLPQAEPPAWIRAMGAYNRCLTERGLEYERSGESAQIVAEAVVDGCASLRDAETDAIVAAKPESERERFREWREESRAEDRQYQMRQVRSQIVRIRANRNTPTE